MAEHDEQLQILRHSASHVMADAVKRLYPGVKLGIGPAIEDGFYYDFDFSNCKAVSSSAKEARVFFLTPEDLPKIGEEMAHIIKQNLFFKKQDVPKKDAVEIFTKLDEIYKIELLKEIEGESVSLYKHGDFLDLCRGPHLACTGEIKAFKLLSVAGAYWKGNEANAMLQRIYGTAFMDTKSLDNFLVVREEARKRDHRRLGKELELFSFHESTGAGLVLYHPKGAMLRQRIVDYITKEHIERGYELISSPHIFKSDIWIRSGHYEYYKEHMYIFESDGQEYAVKPMNCPGHILVYLSRIRSYKEFPVRYFELGSVYRHEKSGVLHGLLRVRGFTQDDAHIFCLRKQVELEVMNVIDFVVETLRVFGFYDFEIELSTQPKDHIGTEENWQEATGALKNALERKGLPYQTNAGGGAFYGPKIDIKLKDALARSWQCATIQCDFALPERFDLKYVDQDGKEQRPVVLHRVILGSLERFIGALVEHYSGALPLWLAPVQVEIVPIAQEQIEYGRGLLDQLRAAGISAEIDMRSEKMQKKIRDAIMQKIPYIAVIGKKEIEDGTISARSRKDDGNVVLKRLEFIDRLKQEINKRIL